MFNLLDQLKKHKPFDGREKENIDKAIRFLISSNNCFDRSNLAGHITAGALVADRHGNILLNHHKKADMWFQFGGHSDGEEDSLSVARREVWEESGISQVEVVGIFDVDVQQIDYNVKRNEPMHFHYDINFLFIVDSHYCNVSDESVGIRWVTIDVAYELVLPDDYGIIRMIDKYKLYINK